jgi:hypothetical protein
MGPLPCDAPLVRPHLCRQFHASYPNERARTAVGRRSDEFDCCAWIGVFPPFFVWNPQKDEAGVAARVWPLKCQSLAGYALCVVFLSLPSSSETNIWGNTNHNQQYPYNRTSYTPKHLWMVSAKIPR